MDRPEIPTLNRALPWKLQDKQSNCSAAVPKYHHGNRPVSCSCKPFWLPQNKLQWLLLHTTTSLDHYLKPETVSLAAYSMSDCKKEFAECTILYNQYCGNPGSQLRKRPIHRRENFQISSLLILKIPLTLIRRNFLPFYQPSSLSHCWLFFKIIFKFPLSSVC